MYEYSGYFYGIVIGAFIVAFMKLSQAKGTAQKIGKIRCSRCDYEGPAKSIGMAINMKVGCPNCQSENWKQVSTENSEQESN